MTMPSESERECKGKPDASRRSSIAIAARRRRCVEVCPFDVFEIRSLESSDRAALSIVGRLKAWAHGNRQAYVIRPADCHACQLCIKACPEDAIRLIPYPPG